jgi:asparagine synthase (glutamine-hydrolysing)
MTLRALAAVHDPRGTLSEQRLRSRFAASMADVPDAMLIVHERFAAIWSGGEPEVASPGAFAVVDGSWSGPMPPSDDRPAALQRLRAARGAFALLAWDPGGGRGLVARDHLGARPLFWATAGSVTYVASEVALLLALLPARPSPDVDELARRLAGRRGAAGQTLYTGIRELAPAHALLLADGGVELRRYWRPEPRRGLEDAGREEAAAAVRDAIAGAVRRSVSSSAMTPGVLVSGGIDSGAVFATAAEQARAAGEPIPLGLRAWFPAHPELDEGEHARALAKRWSTELVAVPLPAGPVTPYAEAFLERWSLPLEHAGSALFAPLHEAAAIRGCQVLVDGEGGDELFGCEPFLIADRLLERRPQAVLELTRELPGMDRLHPRALQVVARRWLAPAILPPRVVEGWRRRPGGGPRQSPDWLLPRAAAAQAGAHGEDWRRPDAPRWQAHLGWLLTDARTALGVQDQLRRTAAMVGAHDAHPLLDVDLVELALGLPPELHFDRRLDRPLLREAMRGLLPESVRLREDKAYFGAPLREALCGPDHRALKATLTAGTLELGALVDRARLTELWQGGPEAAPRGWSAWVAEIWRVFALESWLRREAGAAPAREGSA